MNRSRLSFSAAAAMLLSLSAAAWTLPAAASTMPATATVRVTEGHAATAYHRTAPQQGGLSALSANVTLSASLVLSVRGMKEHVNLTGSGTMTIGNPTTVGGRPAIPLFVKIGPLTGYNSTLGRVQAAQEGTQTAWLYEHSAANPFPAQEVLPLNDHITIGELPGLTLIARDANSEPVVLHSSSITSYLQQNVVFNLASPAGLQDVNHPGPALATIQSLRVTVKSAGVTPTM